MRRVDDFFDRHAAAYHGVRAGMQSFHAITASILSGALGGEVLSVGGLWQGADSAPPTATVTVADLSDQMLRRCRPSGGRVRADACALPFPSRTFDHVVLPLVLHHITGPAGGARVARQGVRAAIREARRVIRPGGRLWVSELCVPPWIYAAELALAPLTRRLLSVSGTPLVVMHTRGFYERAMREAGFADLHAQTVQAADARPTDWITPIIGMSALKVPRALYPVTPTLLTGAAPG